jgi:hypothetical protein
MILINYFLTYLKKFFLKIKWILFNINYYQQQQKIYYIIIKQRNKKQK